MELVQLMLGENVHTVENDQIALLHSGDLISDCNAHQHFRTIEDLDNENMHRYSMEIALCKSSCGGKLVHIFILIPYRVQLEFYCHTVIHLHTFVNIPH